MLIRYPKRMKLGARIRRFREALGLSQQQLADLLGIAQTTVSKWERDISEPTRAELLKLAAALQVSYQDIEPLVGMSKVRHIRLMGYVAAGQAVEYATESVAGYETVDCPIEVPDGAIALKVRGDSMRPLLSDGAVLIFWQETTDPADFLKQICVCHVEGGGAYVKLVERGSAPGLWNLTSLNAAPIEDVHLSKIYVVGAILPTGF